MNEHTLRVLEYHKVTSLVSEYAVSAAGKDAVLSLLPAVDRIDVTTHLQETEEFMRILQSGENPPLDGIFDIAAAVSKLKIPGSILSPADLLHAASTLAAGRRMKFFFQQFEGKEAAKLTRAPLLCAKATLIRPLKHVEDAIISAIDEKFEIKDSASRSLRKIRQQIVKTRDDILNRMSGILQNSGYQKVIQQPIITMRNDRYVLPLKSNFQHAIKGVVHGQSGSRSTFFVEPLEVLEQNNHLAELQMEERDEIECILRELTCLLAREAVAITKTTSALAEIDAVYARARFGIEFNGITPSMVNEGGIVLYAAKHPLLIEKYKKSGVDGAVTPNNVDLDAHHRALILSGPNAGGKTVILKTVGLLSLMAQSGLPVTAKEGSQLPCFKSVFADIGDEQSLEHDLSTFSSHMRQIAEILQCAEKDSLVLLDELGSGTEPAEGAALGTAVLHRLIERGAVTLATTHHNALKLFGSQTNGALNASMEFDIQTLRPTYKLTTGRPGRSYGLDMATRLGVPEEVIRKARAYLGTDDSKLEELLKQVEHEAHLLTFKKDALDKELFQAKQNRDEATTLLQAAREEARTVRVQAKQETRDIVSALRQRLRELLRVSHIDRTEAKKNLGEVEQLVNSLNTRALNELRVSNISSAYCDGDRVRIPRMNKIGTVLSHRRDELEVEVGDKKVKLSINDVAPAVPVPATENTSKAPGWNAKLCERQEATDRLNILGFRVDEGLSEVDRFIDSARVNGISFVTIIHGLGTGALKNAVTEFLKNHSQIACVRSGGQFEGGAGVTVAELKK